MTTLSNEDLTRRPAAVRRALVKGEEVVLTFHGKPYGRIVENDRLEAERAELARLRAEVRDLQGQLSQEAPAA